MRNLRAKNYTGEDGEWAAILGWIFFLQEPDSLFVRSVKEVETIANIKPGKEITLVLRRMVSGIAVWHA